MNSLQKDFETKFTGWAFILAALLLWLGWALSPHHIGEYIVASDFEAIGENVWTWIWMYRIHIFGWVTMGIALFALVSVTARRPYRVVILPGAGMVIIGTFTLAIANAYFYNFGAWGVGETAGKTPVEIEAFMHDILFTNQYVTCFIRFGRIFSGVGLVLLGYALIKWHMVSKWLGWFTALLGLAAMGIILAIPDNFEIYKPLFHIKVIWLIAMGAVVLKQGINLPKSEA
ncbi:hypothetical protein [Winogradskyella aurantia]|uniref:DUF4386 domain-containing protein n=1 Tax=Winogradskyella aurantia TaxID=1915063 RepID=A0A265UNC1_9FLAO|nr:hypothetical protein [Winogradskyella aurantia]OZV66825.1 hypothetical protein CA834_13365 [Winogradskyella aurantia]